MSRSVSAGLAAALLLLAQTAKAQTAHSGFPVDISVARPPGPVKAGGRVRLLYELRLTNFYSGAFELGRIEVRAADGRTIAVFADKALDAMLETVGAGADAGPAHVIGAGRTVIAFVDLALAPGEAAPAGLTHSFDFRLRRPDGSLVERSLTGAAVRVGPAAPVIAPPLRGAGWVAANGLGAPDHRRSFNAVDGAERLAQRFAIDWVKLGPDGRFFQGDPKDNHSYPGHGEPVLAVADARVAAVTDGLPENAGSNPASGRAPTLDSITGDNVVLDLGGGRYALYAHLIPGSIKVKPGDRVKVGQTLALLGNSGNSDAPHLHFQLMDSASPLGSEGMAFALSRFTETGILPDLDSLDSGAAWRPKPGEGNTLRRGEFPLDKAVADFGPRREAK
jgi:hypothetical protein